MIKRETIIKQTSWIGIIGNGILSIAKITVGLLTGSMAVLADGIDSASDIIGSVITLVTAYIISKPPDPRFPYGYSKADTVASKALSFIIFFAGAQLAISTGNRLITGDIPEIPKLPAIYVTIVSIIGKLLLALYQLRMGKKTSSSMLVVNGKNMQNDVIISFSVLVGLIFTFVFNLPILDIITAFLVSLYIMFVAYRIFMQTNMDLMDGIDDPNLYHKIFEATKQTEGVENPHRIRIRKMGHRYIIAIDIEVDGKLTVNESHEIAHNLDTHIRESIINVYDILVHVEPIGDEDKNETYGVSGEDFK